MKNRIGYTALHKASAGGHTDAVAILLGHPRIDPNVCTLYKSTAVGLSAEYGHHDVIELLLKSTDLKTINQIDADRLTPLIYAAKNDHPKVVDMLLKHSGIEVDTKGVMGKSALDWAMEKGHDEVENLICKHKLPCDNTKFLES